MKFSKILGGVFLLGVSCFGMDVKYFVGAGIGHTDYTIKATSGSNSIKYNDGAGLTEIQMGSVINQKHKIYFSIDKINTSGDTDTNLYSLNYNYLINIDNPKIKPFIGGGYATLKYKEYDGTEEFSLDSSILLVNFGFCYDLDKHNSINMQYALSLGINGDSEYDNIKIELDKITKWVISYNYSF